MEIIPTIDSLTNELHQMNNSVHNLGVYGKVIHKTYNEYIDYIKTNHKGLDQLAKYEWVYTNLKRYECNVLNL